MRSLNDFRAEERDDVGAFGKKKARDDFFSDGSAAENVAAFQDDDLLPCFGKIGGIDQAVVTAADDDNVVVLPHSLGLRYDAKERLVAGSDDGTFYWDRRWGTSLPSARCGRYQSLGIVPFRFSGIPEMGVPPI